MRIRKKSAEVKNIATLDNEHSDTSSNNTSFTSSKSEAICAE